MPAAVFFVIRFQIFCMRFKYGLKAQKFLKQYRLKGQKLQKQYALKGQKLLAQGGH